MKFCVWPAKLRERRATVLAVLILLQAICALFFIGDVILDFRENWLSDRPHLILEAMAALALVGGVIVIMLELQALLARMSNMQTGLDVARGQVLDVIDTFFEDWGLTNAERDVAAMILKGLENETIARLRKTAPGTVRAQATSIYAKSATTSRAQFISLFMEELMAGELGQKDRLDQSSKTRPRTH